MRFATKEEANKAAAGKYSSFSPVFVSAHYAPVHGLPTGGWYLMDVSCKLIAGINC